MKKSIVYFVHNSIDKNLIHPYTANNEEYMRQFVNYINNNTTLLIGM